MNLNRLTAKELIEVFQTSLYGIANMVTEGYKTDSGMALFIEPDLNQVEALVKGHTVIKLKFDRDNITWDEADLLDRTVWLDNPSQQLAQILTRCYEYVMEQRKIHYQKNFDPRRKIY